MDDVGYFRNRRVGMLVTPLETAVRASHRSITSPRWRPIMASIPREPPAPELRMGDMAEGHVGPRDGPFVAVTVAPDAQVVAH